LDDRKAECTIREHVAGDGYCWRYRHYAPASSPKADIVCIHGIQSHGGWYEGSCEHLRRAGYRLSFLDRRGAGLNSEDRGDAPSFRRLLDDIAEFLRHLRGVGGATHPVVLLAISWGGKLACGVASRSPGLVDGFALLCPGIVPRVRPPFRDRIMIAATRLFAPRKLFPVPLSDPELFTATPAWQQFIRKDALGLREITARLAIESVRLDYYLRLFPPRVGCPVLLLLAGRDQIIQNAQTRRYVERIAQGEKDIIEYPEAHHTLEFEPDSGGFIQDLENWLGKRVSSQSDSGIASRSLADPRLTP
jgi:alpha-beta hydrolase superfamily lysophospholipase